MTMTTRAYTAGTTRVRRSVDDDRRAKLRTLSHELQDVHRALIEVSRNRHELSNGRVRSRGELLDLLLNDESFAWLGSLSRLIVGIDELAAQDPAVTEAELRAMDGRVQTLLSASDEPHAFGSRYVELLSSEPRVAMSHAGLRAALRDLVTP